MVNGLEERLNRDSYKRKKVKKLAMGDDLREYWGATIKKKVT